MDSIHALASQPPQFDWDELIRWISAALPAVGETAKDLKQAHDADFNEVVLKLDLSCGEFYIHAIEQTDSWAVTEYVIARGSRTLRNGDPGDDDTGGVQDLMVFPLNECRILAESFATLIAKRRLDEAMFSISEDQLEQEQLLQQKRQFIVHRKEKDDAQ